MSMTEIAPKQRAKIVAAITGGVAAFMEEEQRGSQQSAREKTPAATVNLWPVWGREEIMRMRSMWQRRMVCR